MLRSVVRYNKENAPRKNELLEKTYLAKQMIALASRLKKSTHVLMIAYCTVEKNTKTWTSAPSMKLHGTRKVKGPNG